MPTLTPTHKQAPAVSSKAYRDQDEHIGHVALRIAELKTLEAELRELRARCEVPQAVSSCGILKGLAKREVGGDAAARAPHVHVRGAHVR